MVQVIDIVKKTNQPTNNKKNNLRKTPVKNPAISPKIKEYIADIATHNFGNDIFA